MKLTLRLILCFAVAVTYNTVNAQVTVTNGIFPTAGDVYYYADDVDGSPATVTPDAATAQIWDFSKLNPDSVYTDTMYAANNANFPTAEITGTFQGFPVFIDVTNTEVNVIGAELDLQGQILPFPFNTPVTLLWAPMQYGANYTTGGNFAFGIDLASIPFLDSLINAQVPFGSVDSIRLNLDINVEMTVDAWGQMQIPSGYYDVLRLQRDQFVTTAVEVKHSLLGWFDPSTLGFQLPIPTGTDTLQTYDFYSPLCKEAVVSLNTNFITSEVNRATFRDALQPNVGVINTNGLNGTVSVYPNPAVDVVSLNPGTLADGTYRLMITDYLGRNVSDLGNVSLAGAPVAVDITQAPAGIWWLRVLNEQGQLVAAKPIVKK